MQTIETLTNHFLIAMPNLDGSCFEKAVAYVCEHSAKGAIGLVVNNPLKASVEDILAELNIPADNPYMRNIKVVNGGPVHKYMGFVLHRDGTKWANTFYPADEIAVTTSPDILRFLAKKIEPVDVFMTVGYAGWGAGQLEQELQKNNWLACPADPKIIFDVPIEQRWQAALSLLGIKPHQVFHTAGHA